MQIQLAVPADAQGKSLYRFLREQGVSATLIKTVKYGNGFFADGYPVHTDHRLQERSVLSFALPPEPSTTVEAQFVPLDIAYEDDFAMVLNKPAGIAVHPTLNAPGGTLANGYMELMNQRGIAGVFRPVNRIDKNTSGLVLVAKNAFAAPFLAQSAEKVYLALAQGALPLGPGRIEAPIGRRGDSIIGRCVTAEGKPSITEYTVQRVENGLSLAACTPVTGRTHQIRVHFSWLGHPLAGDDLYGGSTEHISRQALHCAEMSFCPPLSTKRVTVTAEMPPDMAALLL